MITKFIGNIKKFLLSFNMPCQMSADLKCGLLVALQLQDGVARVKIILCVLIL